MTVAILRKKSSLNHALPALGRAVLAVVAAFYISFSFTPGVWAQPGEAVKKANAPASSNKKTQSQKKEPATGQKKKPDNPLKAEKNNAAAEPEMIKKALAAIKHKPEAKNKYYMPEAVKESENELNLPVGFTSLDKLGQKTPKNQDKFNKQTTGDADYVRGPKGLPNIETSPTLSWPGLMEKKAGPANGPSPNPSAGFTVSAPLMEDKNDSLYIYRHTPEREDEAHWGMMWSHNF